MKPWPTTALISLCLIGISTLAQTCAALPPLDTATIELWDVEKGVLLPAPAGYQANIVHLEFSPDGALLATAFSDGTMRL
jgi:WD40 repeat protein